MNWTTFPFSRGALAAALALIPGASFMTGCLEEMNLTGSNGGTGGDGFGDWKFQGLIARQSTARATW
jgi:hypothetical protein